VYCTLIIVRTCHARQNNHRLRSKSWNKQVTTLSGVILLVYTRITHSRQCCNLYSRQNRLFFCLTAFTSTQNTFSVWRWVTIRCRCGICAILTSSAVISHQSELDNYFHCVRCRDRCSLQEWRHHLNSGRPTASGKNWPHFKPICGLHCMCVFASGMKPIWTKETDRETDRQRYK